MKIIVQNLQKRSGLAGELIEQYKPDLFLAQEINLSSEDSKYNFDRACFVSRRFRYGTAISSSSPEERHLENIRQVESPHAEVGGFITKKTTIADYHYHEHHHCSSASHNDNDNGDAVNNNNDDTAVVMECISFHGYNGTPFRRYTEYLVDHVRAVLNQVRPTGPAIFAGDFNTWTPDHLEKVQQEMTKWGFDLVYSWEYPPLSSSTEKRFILDHVFLRGLKLIHAESFSSKSDHLGSILEVQI